MYGKTACKSQIFISQINFQFIKLMDTKGWCGKFFGEGGTGGRKRIYRETLNLS